MRNPASLRLAAQAEEVFAIHARPVRLNMSIRFRAVRTAAGFFLLILAQECLLQAQCALCRRALTDSPEGLAMAAGFNRAILFLLGAPFAVAACVGVVLYRSQRTSRAGGEEGVLPEPAEPDGGGPTVKSGSIPH